MSVDTSTPPTRPPPLSAAVPVTVTGLPTGTTALLAGAVIVEDGGAVSVEAVAAERPACSVVGCDPMSASRFTVACCAAESTAADPRSWFESSAHGHWIVPAPKTSAPLACRYWVIECVAVPAA